MVQDSASCNPLILNNAANTMKVLHIIDSAGLYGAEIMLLNLMKEQQQMNINPMLLSIEDINGNSEGSLKEDAVKRGLNAERLTLSRGYSLANGLKIIRFAVENRIDIIHSHGYKANILIGSLPKSLRKTPVISTIHGWTSTKMFSRIWLYTLLDKICLRRMDAIVNVNSLSPRIGGSAERFVIENGIDELKFNPKYALQSDPEISDFCNDSFVFGTLSRLSNEKGLIYLIEAIRLLADSVKNIKTIIIGEGTQREFLQDNILKYGLSDKVLLAGYRNNAYNYLPLFNIFVLPSLTEGLPITILEAMQAGVPIVASSVGGIPDVLGKGKYGITVEPANPKALAEAILYVHSNPDLAKEMGAKARQAVLKKYSSSRMAEDYLKVYESVLKKWK